MNVTDLTEFIFKFLKRTLSQRYWFSSSEIEELIAESGIEDFISRDPDMMGHMSQSQLIGLVLSEISQNY